PIAVTETAVKRADPPTAARQASAERNEEEEQTVTPPQTNYTPILLSSFKEKSDWSPAQKTARRKLIALALAGPLLLSFISIFVARSLLSNWSEDAEPTPQARANTARPVPPSRSESEAAMQPTALHTPNYYSPEDNELIKLRLRETAGGAQYGDLLKAVSAAETRYPRDYRFSYERAK